MVDCACRETHARKRVVLTGGPGAGKTAVLELIRHYFCAHVRVLPEAAGIVFGGGFPRASGGGALRAAQRAIFHVQRELEEAAGSDDSALVLCDRGTVDGAAYWPGPGDFWASVGTTQGDELSRYDAVIHLHTPSRSGYDHANPLRIEQQPDAARIDERIGELWKDHPRLHVVDATPQFLTKASRALALLRQEVPECCRNQVLPFGTGMTPEPRSPARARAGLI